MARWHCVPEDKPRFPKAATKLPLAGATERYSKMSGHELHCVWDAREIPEDRARKGAITCCDECKRQYANYRRRIRSQAKCRLCGRGRRRTSKLDPVLMEHRGVYGSVNSENPYDVPTSDF